MSADLILRDGRFMTLDRSNPTAAAVAIARLPAPDAQFCDFSPARSRS